MYIYSLTFLVSSWDFQLICISVKENIPWVVWVRKLKQIATQTCIVGLNVMAILRLVDIGSVKTGLTKLVFLNLPLGLQTVCKQSMTAVDKWKLNILEKNTKCLLIVEVHKNKFQ